MKSTKLLNIPDNLHQWLKINAIKSGMTLNNYIIELLQKQMELKNENSL